MLDFNDKNDVELIKKVIGNLSKYKTLSQFDMLPLVFEKDARGKYASMLISRRGLFNLEYEIVIYADVIKVCNVYYGKSKKTMLINKERGIALLELSTKVLTRYTTSKYSEMIKDTILMFG